MSFMASNKLTDREIRQAKFSTSPKKKLFDGNGLYVQLNKNGSKYFRLKYRLGVEKSYAIGVYPDISLSEARQEAQRARALIREGKDPVIERKRKKLQGLKERQNSFRSIAEDWINDKKIDWTENHLEDIRRMMRNHIFLQIGEKPVKEIGNIDIINLLNLTRQKGKADTTKRIRQTCERVFRYAVAKEICENNPAANVKDEFRNKNYIKRHYPYLQFSELPRLFSDIENSNLRNLTKIALRLMVLFFVRTNELIGSKWDEFRLDENLWIIPAERMKNRKEHKVPLSRQSKELLQLIKDECPSPSKFVFPHITVPTKHMSSATLLKALYRLGYKKEATVHGFRTTFRTCLGEMGRWNTEALERQMSHMEGNKVIEAYNRAQYLEERTQIMQYWADEIDRLNQEYLQKPQNT